MRFICRIRAGEVAKYPLPESDENAGWSLPKDAPCQIKFDLSDCLPLKFSVGPLRNVIQLDNIGHAS
jgi:hypothetical protein